MTLYSDIHLAADATQADIRAAYRRLAVGRHPDHGGDREAWERIAHAHAVLSDHNRRKRYDETGDETESATRNVEFENAVAILAKALEHMLRNLQQANQGPGEVDMVGCMREVLSMWRVDGQSEAIKLAQAEATNAEIAQRFESVTDDNVMRSVVLARIDGLRAQREKVRAGLRYLDLAEKLLVDARYRWDRPQPAPTQYGLSPFMQRPNVMRG